jgi:YggT family protein
MILLLIQIIRIAASVFSWLLIIGVFLSYIVPPYNSVRRTIDSILNPLLTPIRKVVPAFGGFDFSPVILILLIQVVETLLIRLLSAIG